MRKIGLLLFVYLCFSFIVKAGIPRPEYPRPQLERTEWMNLNGEWTFDFDFGASGMTRKWNESKGFGKTITVPFCPESELSGVQYTDFIPSIWYHRTVRIPQGWAGKRIMLNFGAVDYYTVVYIDGKTVGRHWGGSSSFSFDVTPYVSDGAEHHLVVRAEDDVRSGLQPRGKQSPVYYSQGCDYTRVTGIWQTVWMEAVASCGLKNVRILPEYDENIFVIEPEYFALQEGLQLEAIVKDGDKIVCRKIQRASTPQVMTLPIKGKVKSWSPESPFLYHIDLIVRDKNGKVIDEVKSYAGMRKVHVEGNRLYLNNRPYYLRLVLDQGYYIKGIWTAPSDEDLKRDIELSMAAGFNGARLHQKVFEERFHYWADRLGYLTWGEAASWGCNTNKPEAARNFITEWEEIVVRDRNHPSIIAWTPFNETWECPENREEAAQHDRVLTDVYRLTKRLDYRPVNDASGHYHRMTDLWTVHHYPQSGEQMIRELSFKDGMPVQRDKNREVLYDGQPYFVDEFGGIKWIHGKQYAENSWGYGEGPKTEEEFYSRLEDVTAAILGFSHISGYCYTQLTDVEQEQNGLYNYDRTPKFDAEKLRRVFLRTPAGFANSTDEAKMNDKNK